MRESQSIVGSVADAPANEGRGMQLYSTGTLIHRHTMLRLTAREAQHQYAGEQLLIDQILDTCAAAGCSLPRHMVINYYVSLKTNPLVILAGAEGTGKADFSRLFATALLGPDSSQFALIPSQSAWHTATGEGSYYRSLDDRFTSLRFIDLLHEAAAPTNIGKLYLVCFQRLHPDEIEPYLTNFIRIAPDGQRFLNLPGVPTAKQPLISPNVRISATVDTTADLQSLRMAGLNASVIDMSTPMPHWVNALHPVPVPGLQRFWLRSAIHDIYAAEQKLHSLRLPPVASMTAAPAIRDSIRRSSITMPEMLIQELTLAIVNSFNPTGEGLFDPYNQQRNAQIAYDTQLIQRVGWQTTDGHCPSISEYFGTEPLARRVA